MILRSLLFAGVAATALALPAVAEAATAYASGSVNLRAGPGVGYARITTIPAGARLEVNGCSSWCQVWFHGIRGYVSAGYITAGYSSGHRMMSRRSPAPTWGYYQEPRWDDGNNAWYDGHRWYRNDRWYDQAPGISLFFGMGG